ncbi:MAG: hypothetical protein E3J72_02190 [Planctomycetota bacterium]|nr:MAG: hypothetical protein E3J72_02190 [Planctomycetota bacterium]
MARIIYGISGDGFGHTGRSKEVLRHLKDKGHDILVFGYLKSFSFLKDYYEAHDTKGCNIVTEENKVKNLKTLRKNLRKTPEKLKALRNLDRIFRSFKPDAVISDFEALTGYLANHHRVPLISIDNQAALARAKLEFPRKYMLASASAKVVVKSFMPVAKEYIITTFFTAPVKNRYKRNTRFSPPILRSEVLELEPADDRHILVYQTYDSNEKLPEILKAVGDEKFIVYGFNVAKTDGNMTYKEFSATGFLDDLKGSRAVICNGGLTLITEALYLGKPVLSEPIKKHFEQIINAVYLGKCGYGRHVESLTPEAVREFIESASLYEKNLQDYPKKGNDEILKTIDGMVEKYARQ